MRCPPGLDLEKTPTSSKFLHAFWLAFGKTTVPTMLPPPYWRVLKSSFAHSYTPFNESREITSKPTNLPIQQDPHTMSQTHTKNPNFSLIVKPRFPRTESKLFFSDKVSSYFLRTQIRNLLIDVVSLFLCSLSIKPREKSCLSIHVGWKWMQAELKNSADCYIIKFNA